MNVLRQCVGTYTSVQVERAIPSDRSMDGYVLGLSNSLLLLFEFIDGFYADGCKIVRLGDIHAVRSGEVERWFDKMRAAEGLLDAVGVSSMPQLDDMETVLEHLRVVGRAVILESECFAGEDEDDELFLIGRIVRVAGGTCYIHCFDELGCWDAAPRAIDIDLVTKVQLEARYVDTFVRHMPPFPGDAC